MHQDTYLLTNNRAWNARSHQITIKVFEECKEDFTQRLDLLNEQLASLRTSLTPVTDVPNKVFQAPSASIVFTGRESLLQHVERAFGLLPGSSQSSSSPSSLEALTKEKKPDVTDPGEISDHERKQKRFVLIGLGGSGKTEFCCKFAERTQQRCLPTSSYI